MLLSGDNVVGDGSTWIGPPDGDMTEYLRTLALLKQLPARIIAPGHGPPLDEPSAKIDALIRRRLQREEQIASLLAGGVATVERLVDVLYLARAYPRGYGDGAAARCWDIFSSWRRTVVCGSWTTGAGRLRHRSVTGVRMH